MKILALSLNNLASLAGTHHIRFDETPLAHAGLIAITGKTGAGKSTLLDAMCLALYNEIPRLKGAAGSLKDTGGQDISIKDSKNILRRGTTSGFAELEFIALDGKRYIARWDIRRARNKVDGNLKVDRFVKCLDDGATLTQKNSEVTPLIEKLIGLSFEQFTRAVLLAQSEVGAFLKAKDHERADLLEYLTNSQIFSQVSIKAAEKYSQIKQQRLELENIIGHIEMLSTEEIEQFEQQQKAYNLQLQNLVQSEKLLENEKKWHLDRNRIYAELHGKKEIYDVQLDAVQKSTPQQQLLEQLDQFQAIREQFIQQNALEPKKHSIQQQYSAFKIEFEQIQQQVSTEQNKLSALKQQQQQANQHYANIRPHLDAGLKLDHEIDAVSEQYKKLYAEHTHFKAQRIQPLELELQQHTNQLQTTQSKLTQVQQQLKTTQFLNAFDQEPQSILQRLNEYATRYQSLDHHDGNPLQWNSVDIQQRIQSAQLKISAWSSEHQGLEQLEQTLFTLQTQQSENQKRHYQLNHIQQQTHQILEQMAQSNQLNAELQLEKQQLDTEQNQLKLLHTQIKTEQTAYQQLEQMLAQQRLMHTQSVQELRAQLKADEPCMVCGSHTHPFVEQHELLAQGLQQLQDQQLNQARVQLEALTAEQQQKLMLISKLETRIEQKQNTLNQTHLQHTEFFATTMDRLNDLGLTLEPSIQINEMNTAVQSHLNSLTTQLQQTEQHEKTIIELLQQWRSTLKELQQLKLIQQELTHLEQLIAPIQVHLPDHLKNETPSTWLNQVKQQLQYRMQLLGELKQLDADRQVQQQQLDRTQFQLQTEQQQFEKLHTQLTVLIEHGKDLRQQLLDLTQLYADQPYRVAAEWRNTLEQQANQLEQQIQAQQHSTTQIEQQLHQGNLKLQAFVTQLKAIEQQLEQAQQSTHAWRLNHPQVTQAMIEHYLSIDLTTHQTIRRNLNNQKQLLENAKSQWQLLEEQYEAHLRLKPEHELEEIEKRLEVTHQDKLEQQNQLNELEAKLRINANNQANFAKYQQQIEQIKAEEYRWGRIYDLIGHKEGTKFQKIAQEHHLDILVEYANQQLQPLSPRYQLHRIPNSLSLAIIDLDMNSEIRPVLSLSGGETFLVSLALALAIANMASGSMKLESLFIDEGFGTLDPASLHMVMNALDHLQSQGRKVVLISHVQEMHERIPVQIQVKPVGAGASSLHVVG